MSRKRSWRNSYIDGEADEELPAVVKSKRSRKEQPAKKPG